MAMSEKTWKDKYKIHDDAVDEQHQYLFDLATHIANVESKPAMIECAMNLFKHMREHFRDEEALMKKYAYPGLKQQVEAHDRLLSQLVEISQKVPAADFDPNTLQTFMNDEFLAHTLELDMLFGKFMTHQAGS